MQKKDFTTKRNINSKNEIEKALIEIWKEVLVIEKISLFDDFFLIGGNSILAMKTVSSINEKFLVELKIKELYLNSNIVSIAKLIESIFNSKSFGENLKTAKTRDKKDLFLALPFQTKRFQSFKLGILIQDNAVLQLEFIDVDRDALSRAIDTLVSRHESLRVLFTEKDGKVFQKVFRPKEFKTFFSFIKITKSGNKENEIKSIIDEASEYLFDYEKERPFKCHLVKYDHDNYLFLFIIDHIIYDAHSIKIIEEELSILYNGYKKGIQNSLDSIEVKLSDYVDDYYRQYSGDKLIHNQSYYKKLFENFPSRLKIHFIDSSGLEEGKSDLEKTYVPHLISSKKKKTEGYRFTLSEGILKQIHDLTQKHNISVFNFFLASYVILLKKISGQNDFIVDSPVSIRDKQGYSKIIGWLTGAMVTRTIISNSDYFEEILLKSRDQILKAMDHIHYSSFVNDMNLDWKVMVTQLNMLNDINTSDEIIIDFEDYHYQKKNIYFDFSFIIRICKNGVVINCHLNNDAPGNTCISEICKKFISIIETVIISPNIQIKNL